jgi:hypothetical protein
MGTGTAMATPPSGPDQAKRLTDLLVLVLSHTDLGKAKQPGEIRKLLSDLQLYDGTALDLGLLWAPLLAEPGMSEFKLAPIFLQLKEWESRLESTIKMPPQLASIDRNQAKKHIARFPEIKQSELDPLLYPSLASAVAAAVAPAPVKKPEAPKPAEHPPAAAAKRPASALTGRRKALLAAAVAVLVVALAFVGITLFSRPGSRYPTDKLEAILKLEQGRRVRYSVSFVIADPRWQEMSPSDRHQALDRLFKAVEPEGIQSLLLLDAAGASRGVASSLGGERVVRVE